jgi:hypothetical protein
MQYQYMKITGCVGWRETGIVFFEQIFYNHQRFVVKVL